MNSMLTFLFIGVFLLIYGAINYYIGLRGWQYLFSYISILSNKVYWVVYWCIAFSYILVRIGYGVMPKFIALPLTYIGTYWMAAMFYLLQIIVLLDIIRIVLKRLDISPLEKMNTNPFIGGAVICVVAIILILGTKNANSPIIKHYDLNVNKKAGSYEELHVVMVSDFHLGDIVDKTRLEKIIKEINALEPDIVLLPGDVIDGNTKPFMEQNMASEFKRIKSRLGVYAVPGNHEYFGENEENMVVCFKNAGINLLRDDYIQVDNSFYIIGKDDPAKEYRGKSGDSEKVEDKSLEKILQGVNKSLPLILMIHQPVLVDESIKEGIDLQLSGHTHKGQLFPINYITQRTFKLDWGHLKQEGYNLIVSSGVGTWGPPIRIGNRPEIVDIWISFQEQVKDIDI